MGVYPTTAKQWLEQWDSGEPTWTIEMGGIGPGYEQCIQITAAEILRYLVACGHDPETWDESTVWEQERKSIEHVVFGLPMVDSLGLSGAQWGAALSLATCFYRQSPEKLLTDPELSDRRILVTINFPHGED